jgi:hypothetical protein
MTGVQAFNENVQWKFYTEKMAGTKHTEKADHIG